MIVAVQWALASPTGWVDIDLGASGQSARRWLNLAKKAEPTGTETIDNQAGFLFDVCIQGVHLYGFDHVAGEPISGGGLRFYGWNDDVADFGDPQSSGYRWGETWEFLPPAPDPRFGGRVNTRQRKTIFTEHDDPAFLGQSTSLGPVEVRPWSQWVTPPEQLTRHGVWLRDETLWRRHFEVRSRRDWREWA